MMLSDSRASVVTGARLKFDIVSILLGANARGNGTEVVRIQEPCPELWESIV